MKEEFGLTFCFKGTRSYVQGPDIFDEALKCIILNFEGIRNVKYSAHKMLHSNATLIISSDKGETNFNSLITFEASNLKYYASVVENFEPINCTQEYSELEVQTSSIIVANRVHFFNTLQYSFSEIIVSMNKHYLQKMSDSIGKWIVTKLELNEIDFYKNVFQREISLELVKNFNNMLTKSAIYIEDKLVGYIYFSLVKN